MLVINQFFIDEPFESILRLYITSLQNTIIEKSTSHTLFSISYTFISISFVSLILTFHTYIAHNHIFWVL